MCSTRWPRAGRSEEARVAAPRPPRARSSCACTTPRYLDDIAATRGPAGRCSTRTRSRRPSRSRSRCWRRAPPCRPPSTRSITAKPAFALVRPPGHHAEAGTARWASASSTTSRWRRRGASRAALERVAIVDIDVHHGNGTQCDVLRRSRACSTSRPTSIPFYPGTGAADEIGQRRRARDSRSTCRSRRAPPMPTTPGLSRRDRAGARPVRAAAAARLGRLRRARARSARVDADDDRRLRRDRRVSCAAAAARHGALALVTEGGYDLTALASCLEASFAAIDRDGDPPASGERAPRRHRAANGRSRPCATAQAPYWRETIIE